jgi:K+-sensing histidine kinase KdpD
MRVVPASPVRRRRADSVTGGFSLLAMRRLPQARRCLVAAVVVLVTFALRVAILGLQPGAAYLPLLPIIVLTTVLLGLAPGLFAAALGWAMAVVWFVEPVGGLRIKDWGDVAIAVFFPAAAAFTAVVVEVFIRVAEE